MPVIGYLGNKVDPRYLLTVGFVGFGIMSLYFGNMTLGISPWTLLVPIIVTGFALSFVFVPIATQTYSTLRNDQIGNASGIFNLLAEYWRVDRYLDCADAAGAAKRRAPVGDRRLRVADAVLVRAAGERADGLSDPAYGGAERAACGGVNNVSATRAAVAAVGVCGCVPMDVIDVLCMRGGGVVLPQGSARKAAGWSALKAAR